MKMFCKRLGMLEDMCKLVLETRLVTVFYSYFQYTKVSALNSYL